MKKLLTTITFGLIGFYVHSQTCAGVHTPPSYPTESQSCSKTSSDFVNHYNHLESYIPTLQTAEKVLHVNLIIWQENDGTTNWQNTPDQISRLNQIMTLVNSQWLDKDAGPTDPVPGVTEIPNLDKRFHIQVEGIYFMQNSTEAHSSYFSGKEQYMNANHPELLNQVNIHIINSPHTVSGAWGWSNGAKAQYPAVVTSDDPNGAGYSCTPGGSSSCPVSTPDNVRDWSFAHHLAHELAHNMDLLHVYFGGHEACNTSAHDYMDDLFPQNAPYCNPPSPPSTCNVCVQNMGTPPTGGAAASPNDGWTNNLMNGNEGRYLSPKQCGKAHRAFALYNISNFTSGFLSEPIEITQNEVWDFAMQLYRPLIIKSGNTLTVSCLLKCQKKDILKSKQVQNSLLMVVTSLKATLMQGIGGKEFILQVTVMKAKLKQNWLFRFNLGHLFRFVYARYFGQTVPGVSVLMMPGVSLQSMPL